MTDEELAKIRQRVIEAKKNDEIGGADFTFEYWNDVSALLAENAAMREIVQAVAHGTLAHYEDDTPYCLYCTQEYTYPAGITHTPACPVTKARALLGISSQPDR